MLKRVIDRLCSQGFDEVTVNVHHFGDQIVSFIENEHLPAKQINVSDETQLLLDTGGGILNAERFLAADDLPFLVHNVDILSNADLKSLYDAHLKSRCNVTLLVSDRDSSRRLVFDRDMNLKGWKNLKTNETRPTNLIIENSDALYAFSGIYVMSPDVFSVMKENGFEGKFPIMDFFLSGVPGLKISGVVATDLKLIDIGKPDTLRRANLEFF